MSDTPRTDSTMKFCFGDDREYVPSEFARKLELELNELQHEVHQHQLCDEEILKWRKMAEELVIAYSLLHVTFSKYASWKANGIGSVSIANLVSEFEKATQHGVIDRFNAMKGKN